MVFAEEVAWKREDLVAGMVEFLRTLPGVTAVEHVDRVAVVISAAAVRAEGAEAKRALSDVVELLHGYCDVHRALAIPEGGALIDAATYIRRLGCAMRRVLLDRMM